MKKKNYLISAMAVLFAVTSVAQDVTPSKWKFSEMPVGSASSLFLVEGASGKGNLKYAFRLADNMDGAIVMASAGAASTNDYTQFTDAEKKVFTDFYNACQIIDGGSLGHLFCYQGKNSTATDSRITKATGSFTGAQMHFFSKNEGMTPGIYRVTVDIRMILNAGQEAKVSIYAANSWYDPMHFASGEKNKQFDQVGEDAQMKFYSDYNDIWQTYQFEVSISQVEDHITFPIVFKFGFGKWLEESILLMRDLKIEKISEPTFTEPKLVSTYHSDWSDIPSSIDQTYNNNQPIIYAADKSISVLDAKSTIKVYNITGELINTTEPTSTVTTIPVSQTGAYIVKVGTIAKKVVL